MINILAFGQSNMEGRYGPAVSRTPPGLRAWDWKKKQLVEATLGQHPFHSALGGGIAGNLAFRFCELLTIKENTKVNLAFFAAGGMKIEYFIPPQVLEKHGWENEKTGKRFGPSLAPFLWGEESHANQMLQAVGAQHYDAVLIHQGEANSSTKDDTAEVLAEKYKTVIDLLNTSKYCTEETPIIFGRINPLYPHENVHSSALELIREKNIKVVDWKGIEDIHSTRQPGNRHATGFGLEQLGDRYYEAYSEH